MSKKVRDIGQAFWNVGDSKPQSFTAEVVSVDGDTCVVEDDGYTYYDVRLLATIDSNQQKVLISPAVGSWVMVSRIRNSEALYVSQVSQVQDVTMNITGNYIFKNNETSLKSILNELIKELKAAIITTPAGAGSIAPSTVAKLTLIDQNINKLLKE